ncbi:hypothetical protein [Niabella sp.]|uniref:hypothetical protein n=1 Tax=Niabella sp. TaxID=1962976 RepID=UPI002629026F|nr:hypothetical protein [Niabella sp.]
MQIMHFIKKNLVAIVALGVLSVTSVAFTTFKSAHPMAMQWYVLNSGGNPANANDYTLSSTSPPGQDPGCPTAVSSTVCSIQANPGTGGHPSASDVNAIKLASSNFTTTAANLEYKRP